MDSNFIDDLRDNTRCNGRQQLIHQTTENRQSGQENMSGRNLIENVQDGESAVVAMKSILELGEWINVN
jgi:hypothetical protein